MSFLTRPRRMPDTTSCASHMVAIEEPRPAIDTVKIEESWQPMVIATLREMLKNNKGSEHGASLFIYIANELIKVAPDGTRTDRLRVVWHERASHCVRSAIADAIPLAHERQRLLGPVEPDRELTADEKREHSKEIEQDASNEIWDFISLEVDKQLARHTRRDS